MVELKWTKSTNGKLLQLICRNGIPLLLPMKYLTHIDDNARSPLTSRTYASKLCHFLKWLDSSQIDLNNVTKIHLQSFSRHLRTTTHSESSRKQIIAQALRFLLWCMEPSDSEKLLKRRRNHLKINNAKGFLAGITRPELDELYSDLIPRTKKKTITVLTYDNLNDIRRWIMDVFSDDLRLRCLYRLVFELLWDGALRRGELLNLEVPMFNWSDNSIRIKNLPERYESAWLSKNVGPLLKTGERLTHVSEQTMQWAYKWYTEYRPKEAIIQGHGLLLCSVHPTRKGEPMTVEALRWLFKLLNRSKTEGGPGIGIPFHPHTLRHTWATMAIEDNVPLDTVQKYLGHSSISTTQQYLHVADPKLRQDLQEWRSKHAHRYEELD